MFSLFFFLVYSPPGASPHHDCVKEHEEACFSELLDLFNFENFTGEFQKEAIMTSIEGKSILAIGPTGIGKSLIYQFPIASKLAHQGKSPPKSHHHLHVLAPIPYYRLA